MHKVITKSILNNDRLDIYRGCSHGCIYCKLRSDCYGHKYDFEDVEIKVNALELLEANLKDKYELSLIKMGNLSDPYNKYERDYEYTKKALELIYRYGFGVSILTKSDLILRDIDLISKINQRNKAIVQISLTVANDNLSRIIEPKVSITSKRFEVLKTCKKYNIPTIVWLNPCLPFISDSKENILDIINMCHDADVKGIVCFKMGLNLRNGSKEYYYQNLDRYFKGLKEKYMRIYGNDKEILSLNNVELMNYFHEECHKRGIMHDVNEIFTFINDNDNALKK